MTGPGRFRADLAPPSLAGKGDGGLGPVDGLPVVRVKVCGIRSPEVAVEVARAGADLLGLNFARVSKRRTDVPTATRIAHATRDTAAITVGIFVEQAPDEIAAIAREVGLDAVQLSGECDRESCRNAHDASGLPVIAVVRLAGPGDLARAIDLARAPGVAAILVDAPGTVGGAGHAWDHAIARDLVEAVAADGVPTFLAGGLDASNVAAALAATGAWGADVASGVETGGMTDSGRVRDFVAAARGATVNLPGSTRTSKADEGLPAR